MNLRTVSNIIAYLLGITGILMACCGLISIAFGEPAEAWQPLMMPGLAAFTMAVIVWALTRTKQDLTRRDGIGVVTFGWLIVGLVGAIPYYAGGIVPTYASACFESFSGITTTGASVIPVLETVPKGILLWRVLSQFIGGMGVLILVLAVLPFAGSGVVQLFRAEIMGPSKDRLEPRVASTAKWLWMVYVGLTVVVLFLLRFGGLSWFDAICHALGTTATGGFSTHTASVGAFNSLYVEIVMSVFMVLSSISFALHYRALRGDFAAWRKDGETRFFLGTLLCIMIAVGWVVGRGHIQSGTGTWGSSIRETVFTCASLVSTSGFVTVDYEQWPSLAKGLLFFLMLMGGCAGSTAGGIKAIRIHVLFKVIKREIRQFIQPQAVIPVRMGRKFLDDRIMLIIVAFIALYIFVVIIGILIMLTMIPDTKTAVSSVISCISNVGPGFGAVGPVGNYAAIPQAGQVVLALLMVIGRLELYTVLAIFIPSFWRK